MLWRVMARAPGAPAVAGVAVGARAQGARRYASAAPGRHVRRATEQETQGILRWSAYGAAAALLMAMAAREVPGQESQRAPCVRISFSAWAPPLDWSGAGHSDSAAGVGAAARRIRDSVFTGQASAGGRDEMQWSEVGGTRQLLLYPSWWPAGVLITFTSAAGASAPGPAAVDTLAGDAVALVADASQRAPRATARVLRGRCPAP